MYDFDVGVNAVDSASCAASTCQERARQEPHTCRPAAAAEEDRHSTAAAAAKEGRQNTAPTTSPTPEGCWGGSTTATFAQERGREPRCLMSAVLPDEYECATCCKLRIRISKCSSW